MLDYSLLRLILTDILEKLQPFKVVQEVKRGHIYDVRVNIAAAPYQPPPGKRWELLSGQIYHVNGIAGSQIWAQHIEGNLIYFMDSVAQAAVTDYYPIDLRGSRVIVEQGDCFRIFVGNIGTYAILRVLETDV